MLIRFGYEMTISCPQPTHLVCLLAVSQERLADLRSPEVFETLPGTIASTTYLDHFGNRCRRLTVPAGETTLRGDATILDIGLPDPILPDAREMAVEDLPYECLIYLMGSRYCETDRLSQIAWDRFGSLAPGWTRVQAVVDFVHDHIRFDYMQARATRTAFEAYEERVGVCRDFAHLAVALLRCLNIPARYVNGHLGDIGYSCDDPMDFAAWIEVWLDGAWRTFDPRNNMARIGRIVVARGRDAADVPLINSFGPHLLTGFTVWTDEVPDPATEDPPAALAS